MESIFWRSLDGGWVLMVRWLHALRGEDMKRLSQDIVCGEDDKRARFGLKGRMDDIDEKGRDVEEMEGNREKSKGKQFSVSVGPTSQTRIMSASVRHVGLSLGSAVWLRTVCGATLECLYPSTTGCLVVTLPVYSVCPSRRTFLPLPNWRPDPTTWF
jgi:hypothetical protein